MYGKKITLVKLVFEKAKQELPKGSKTSIASYISSVLEEKFGFAKDERTFVRYYKSLVEEKKDYNIDDITLDQLSSYLGYKNFKEFCENTKEENIEIYKKNVKITVSDGKESTLSESLSNVIINITNSPVFNLPEFVTKHSQSLGLVGILIFGGFLANKMNYFSSNEKVENKNQDSTVQVVQKIETGNLNKSSTPQTVVYIPKPVNSNSEKTIMVPRKKECMYWKNDHYETVFCDQKISGTTIEAIDEGKLLMKKIIYPDTLTAENALGKVWYDKSNHKVEFFTHYGIHPTNGKTLKPVTKYILEKYVKK